MRLWAAGDMIHLTDLTAPEAGRGTWDARTRSVRLFSAANETVSFQLVIDPVGRGAGEVSVEVSPLVDARGRELPAGSVRLFRMVPVAVREFPAWYLRLADGPVARCSFYDALIPLGGRPVTVAEGERLAIWVDVYVPRDAEPGEYTGSIEVRTGRFARRRATLAVEVYGFVLPDARPVACMGGFANETIFRQFIRRRGPARVPTRLDTSNPDVRAALIVIRQLMRLAHAHRLDLFDATIHPDLKRDVTGAVRLRWADYDAIVNPYLDGTAFDDRIGVAGWPAPFRSDWPDPTDYGGLGKSAYRKTAAAIIAQTAAHYRRAGTAGKLFFWPRAGGTGPDAYRRHLAAAGLIRSAAPKAQILTQLAAHPPAETGWTVPQGFSEAADMFAPPGSMLEASAGGVAPAKDRPLAGLWLRPGQPPYLGGCGVLDFPADVRALAWVATKYRCAGIFLPEVLNWTGGTRADPGPAADRLFYPGNRFGTDGVLPSVRLKRLRRGLQDTAYLWLLRRRGREAVAQAMIDTMVHYAGRDSAGDHYLDPRLNGWVRDGKLWTDARRILAEEIFAAMYPEAASRRRLLAQRLAWKRLQQRACNVRLERIRSRIDPIAGGRYRAVLSAELFNSRTRPVRAELRIASLPRGWRAVKGKAVLSDLAGGQRAVAVLAAEGDYLPTGADGKLKVPLSFSADMQERGELTALVPVIQVGHVRAGRITIDGDLGDWPLRTGNAAAGFRLLGRRGRVGTGLARNRTTVLALRDDRNLYLAFRCGEPAGHRPVARPSNVVRYDQLLAAGEDLVEVILDPGRGAKAAEDLFHLVVKANGVVLAERGVRSDPPLGRSRAWPVRPVVVVAGREGLWIVELSISLGDFGPAGRQGTWGINFARFSTAERASSSWAGATRYFYNPANLGTMYLAGPAGVGGR